MVEENAMTVVEAAAYLGVSRIAVLRAIYRGALPAGRFGRSYVLRRPDVEAYKEGRPWTRKPGWPTGKRRKEEAQD